MFRRVGATKSSLSGLPSVRSIFAVTKVCLLEEKMLQDVYYQESFEALQRFKSSTTYPGPIKAATPGDTRFYSIEQEYGEIKEQETLLDATDRHYWRPVVDDPMVTKMITLRIRFKEESFDSPSWINKLHVISIMCSPDSTIQEVVDQIKLENSHCMIAHSPFFLAVDGKELERGKTLRDYATIQENSALDALDTAKDHLFHQAESGSRPKDWNVDEITDSETRQSPYKEIIEGRSSMESTVPRPLIFTQPPERVRLQNRLVK